MDGLIFLLLGSVLFVLLGALAVRLALLPMKDFRHVYYASRCVIQHHDPYDHGCLLRGYEADEGSLPSDPAVSHGLRLVLSLCTNLPTALFVVAPFAVLPWKLAEAIWLVLVAAFYLLASFLTWNLAAKYSPRVAGALIFLLLAGSELLLLSGNAAGLVVALCAIAVWCFLRERWVLAGMVCLALGLAIKPHDAGLIWLYFLLAGGVHRKRALQTLALTVALAVPAVLWVSHSAPHWPQELHSNLATATAPGGRDDPGPATGGGRGLEMIVSLQAAVSLLRDDPHFYNPVVYAICGAPLIVWGFKTLRAGFAQNTAWFALAAAAALSMLPVYHRTYDARLLLLTVPACAMLWIEGGPIAWCALLLNTAGILLTGDLLWIVLFQLTGYSPRSVTIGMVPAPLILLALGLFYLWVYVGRGLSPAAVPEVEGDRRPGPFRVEPSPIK